MTRLMTATAICALSAGAALADCETVTFSDVGWTDITATTAATSVVLDALGYETETLVLSVPVTYTSLAEGRCRHLPRQLDADDGGRYRALPRGGHGRHGAREPEGAKYTLATNAAGRGDGHRGFRRHRRAADALDAQIYGSSPAMTATG
jgi:glycine betaine/proline transport system substrate-binding protein